MKFFTPHYIKRQNEDKQMPEIIFKTIAETEKCFLDERIETKKDYTEASMLLGERFSFQLCWQFAEKDKNEQRTIGYLKTESPVSDWVSVQRIDHVPVRMTTNPGVTDENYLRREPGIFPDLLRPMNEKTRITANGALCSAWVDIRVPEDAEGGKYPISFAFVDPEGNTVAKCTFTAEVIPALLPDQEIAVTQWFHADCLAAYYGVEMFSEEHWAVISRFIDTAVDNGINMILTPVLTPALDTYIGGERPTTQLVDISYKSGKWSFGYEKLERWVNMCLELGVEYFEISHLFTQWGAHHAPKVMVDTDDGYIRMFGWDTDACGDEYRAFLTAFLPSLLEKLDELGVKDKCRFHISDEPGGDKLESYLAAKSAVADLLDGCIIMDALSDYSFYEQGVVEKPVVSINHMQPYLDAGVENLWTYYCCCQDTGVSNRFLSMPTSRNRIIGQQFYKYNIEGFLHWGYNFYFAHESTEFCDPYICTDGGFWVPAGDAFSVYPAPGGSAYETIHLLGFTAALYDLRAFKLCEELCGRDAVMAVIEEAGEVGFKEYPLGDDQILGVREKINRLIAENI